jgi:hypothetical protein
MAIRIPLGGRWESLSEDNSLTTHLHKLRMPTVFHLTLTSADGTLRVRRRRGRGRKGTEKTVSSVGEMSTLRPTLDLEAPELKRPHAEIPDDIEYYRFGGKSPGFCLTGKCRCGDCGRAFRSSRYTYDDYVQDVEEYDAEYGCDAAEEEDVEIVETYSTAKVRIVHQFQWRLSQFASLTRGVERELAAISLFNYFMEEPFMETFLDENAPLKAVIKSKLCEFQGVTQNSDLLALCETLLSRFY